jgi:hypothetical protein
MFFLLGHVSVIFVFTDVTTTYLKNGRGIVNDNSGRICYIFLIFFELMFHIIYSDKRLPRRADPHEVRLLQVEMERVKKWLKMLKNWEGMSSSEKLRRRIYKGIPNSLRGQVWSQLLNLETIREEQKGKYEVRAEGNAVFTQTVLKEGRVTE